MGTSKKLPTAIGLGFATAFVLTLASISSHLIDNFLLIPYKIEYLRTISFIVVIAVLVSLSELFLAKTSPLLHKVLGVYLPLITTNCAVLGVALLNSAKQHNLWQSAAYGFGAAIGFGFVLLIFASLRERLEQADTPKAFKGTPIALITAGILSLAFMGFAGWVK